jgi:hypothetical protein
VCVHPSPAPAPPPPAPCPAKGLGPAQRQRLAVAALAAAQPVTDLARQAHVSRRFVYRQAAKAGQALRGAFAPAPPPAGERPLFHLPVTRSWLRQLTLGLVLVCHSSYRGVVELLADLFDWPTSVGAVHNAVRGALARARPHNERDLSAVRVGAHDEVFQAGRPVLVGADVESTYCYLLSPERRRDAGTWAARLRGLRGRGFAPEATVADGGPGLRAGQRLGLPGVPCRGDVFHLFHYDLGPLRRYLENRAYEAVAAADALARRQARSLRRRGRAEARVAQRLRFARAAEARAVALADDVALLVRWLREDVLAVAGPDLATRRELYDFILAELRARGPAGPRRLGAACALLEGRRDDLLAFAAELDRGLGALAAAFAVPAALAREALRLRALGEADGRRWRGEAALRRRLRRRWPAFRAAVAALARQAVRASSVVENLNGRLRGYFFLRRRLGPEYLGLLQFFLNHRRFARSERPERVGKSPAELLTGRPHAHWLELLGYTRFRRG